MKQVDFIITNPNHHVLITLPVARKLVKRGVPTKFVSLCEVRKFNTPEQILNDVGLPYKKFNINVPKAKPQEGQKPSKLTVMISGILRWGFWTVVLKPKLKKWFKNTTHAVMLNDTAYPGNYILRYLKQRKIKTILMQEGIRFPLPVEETKKYGGSGADVLIAWGRKSKTYFDQVVASNTEVVALGSPGYDKSLYIQQSLDSIPDKIRRVAIFGNPIDDQKFTTTEEKFALYIDLARTLVEYGKRHKRKLEVIFKNHPRESASYLRKILKNNDLKDVKVYDSSSDIDIIINTVDAGIVFASTVGINVIIHGKKLGVVKLKNHDYLGDYVQDSVAYGLNIYEPEIAGQLDEFLSGEHYHFRNYRNYLENFASNSGESDDVVAEFISKM